MRYIIKNGKIYGIYNQNYASLAGKPSINNHELAEGISYSSEDLELVVGPISQKQYDDMPTHNPQTIYVVYDDEIDPSSTAINYLDLDNKPQINGQILTGNKSLSSLNIYSKEEVRNLIAAGRSILVVSTKPASPSPNTLYYVETSTQSVYHVFLYDSNTQEADLGLSTIDLSDYYTKTQADNRFEILTNKVNTITSASTTDEYPSAKATFDYAAPLASAYSIATTSTADSNCVFNMRGPASGSYRIEETRIIADASMINPIQGGTSANSWGIMKVNQTFLTDPNRVYIEQIFTAYYTDSKQINDKSVVFRRTGSCNATGLLPANIYDNRANITWKPWYPVEYPNTNATLTPVGSNYRVSCSARFNVTGGVLTFAIENINISYTDTSQSISPTSSSFQFKIDQLQTNIPFKTSQAIYSSLYKEPRESTDSKSEMALVGITNESGLCYLRCYWMHPSITYQYATGRYAGYIIQNLGY